MANDNDNRDALTAGLLLVAGAAAGYAAGRWVLARWLDARSTAPGPTPPPETPAPEPAAPSGAPAQSGLSRRFDPLFERYRGPIPIEYLRALASRESDMNPAEQSGPAWGLMQIVEEVRRDYNRAHGTAYSRQHLLDPAVNVAMATWLLRHIITSYARHADVPNLRADWSNPRYLEILTLGWNGGYSDAPRGGGVGSVVRYLKARGQTDITIDDIHRAAGAAGATRHLSNPAKVRWSKSVAALYMRERARSLKQPALAFKEVS